MERTKRVQKIKNENRLLYRRTDIDGPRESRGHKFLYFLVLLVIFAMIYVFLFSNIFKVKVISVSGLVNQDQGQLQSIIKKDLDDQFFKDNILVFDTKVATYHVNSEMVFKTLSVKRKFPDTIDVRVEEYPPQIVWQTGSDFYEIDERGKVTLRDSQQKNDLPLVIDKKSIPIEVGKSAVSPDFVKFIKYIYENFPSLAGKKISSIEVNENINEISVFSEFPFYVIFDTTRDPETELNNLITVHNMLADKSVSYIDLRIENRVFYK